MTRKVQGKSDGWSASITRPVQAMVGRLLSWPFGQRGSCSSYSSTAVCRSSIKWTPEHTEVRPSVEKRLCCTPGQQCWFTATRLASGQPFALSFPACLLVVSSTISTARLVGVSLKSWEELENNTATDTICYGALTQTAQ